ncbi:hypothetical protein E3P81_00395 [Wallemia ichthyophaga]|nr:hypothetical protein E3P97_00397 [Wallemia ichthyophaga]TIB35534.1 hypothetical protein E3P85_00397 [Wallemia ichthyophaga]TIB50573.1 hypothetical protein E3P82_00397 [Wallemia ichthyophaga]TIB54240.1 hypothetical protein E3P81_00395 [Wallemia ichthyophaga]TIB56740.1 hypothetical protein E3P80_00397 [Wallemia ichthyophaga]
MNYNFKIPGRERWSQSQYMQSSQSNYDHIDEFDELNTQLTDKLSLETDWIFSFNHSNQFPQINSSAHSQITNAANHSSRNASEAHLQNLFHSKPNTFPASFNTPTYNPKTSLSKLSGNDNPLHSLSIPSTVTVWFGGLPINITPEVLAKALQNHECPPIALPTVIDRSHCAFASFIDPNVISRLSSFELGGRRIKCKVKHATGQVASSLSDAGLLSRYDNNLNAPSTSGVTGQRPVTSPDVNQLPHLPNNYKTERVKRPESGNTSSLNVIPRQPTPTSTSTPTQLYNHQINQSASSTPSEHSAVAAAAAAASLTALSVLKTPQVIQAASAPEGPGREILEQTQHYLGLLVDGFQTQASNAVNESGGQFFELAESISQKLKEPVVSVKKDESTSTPLPQSEEEPSVTYTWKGDKRPRRFFILKALSKNDLDTSRHENRWSTQPQNEEILNKAYNEASHVILFMSANKQRGFYGLARMSSKIPKRNANDTQEEMQSNLQAHFSPHFLDKASLQDVKDSQTRLGIDGLQSSDEGLRWSAPGQMQDDFSQYSHPLDQPQNKSAPIIGRDHLGQVVERDNRMVKDGYRSSFLSPPPYQQTPSPMDGLPPTDEQLRQKDSDSPYARKTRTFGHPFSIEWLSTRPVPFSNLKGINNPWNMNRPVKVSRDGTEVETKVGERLVEEFGFSASQLPCCYPTLIVMVKEVSQNSQNSQISQRLLSGATSGFAAAVALQPFDVIKTRLQQVEGHNDSLSEKNIRNMRKMLKSTRVYDITKGIIKDEGLAGLWRGTTPTLWRCCVKRDLRWVDDELTPFNLNLPRSSFTLLQSDLYRYRSILGALGDIVRQSGPRGLLAGFSASALRDAPYAGLYVVLYERMKEYGSHLQNIGSSSGRHIPAPVIYSVSGLLAGTSCTLITHP